MSPPDPAPVVEEADAVAPQAAEAEPATPVAVATAADPIRVPPPPASPVLADALGVPVAKRTSAAGLWWLLAWLLSLAIIAGAVVAAWHGRVSVEHAWPRVLWLFRLLPGGVPV